MEILTLASALPARDSQFRISRSNAGKTTLNIVRTKTCDDVSKGTPRANWWKLTRIAYEDQPIHSADGFEQSGHHFLGEHRAFVHDDCMSALLALITRQKIASSAGIIPFHTFVRTKELRTCFGLVILSAGALGNIFHSDACLTGGRKQEYAMLVNFKA